MRQRIAYLAAIYVWTLLTFVAAKCAFMACCHGQQPVTLAVAAQVVGHGLSLDLSTALYFLLVPLLACIASVWVRVPRPVLYAYWLLVAIAFAMAFVADTSLYPFWQYTLDASCLQYLSTPTEAMASVSTAYLLLRLLLLLLTAAVIGWGYWLTTRRLFPLTTLKTSKQRLLSLLCFLLLVPVMVVGIRGGVSESTTNVGQVYFSRHQFLNHSAVNPVFSFLSSFEKTASHVPEYHFMSPDECRQTLDGLYPTQSLLTDTLLRTQRPNVVIILLESCGEMFAPYMPALQRLKREGINFSHCYANSYRTDRGTVCTWSGYPAFPTSSVMKMPAKTRALPSIARTLQAHGYDNTYLYGGDINFTNMRSYLMGTGFEHLHWQKDYSLQQQQSAKWGVRDDITFQTLGDMIEQVTAEPFLIGFSTLSSHEPWDVPEHYRSDAIENAFCYLDRCIEQFISRMRQSPQWDNLLIVLLPDHGISFRDIGRDDLRHDHIPLVWTGGAIRAPRQIDRWCNQTDLAATLLAQMGLPHHDFRFSRDVMSAHYTHPFAAHTFNNGIFMSDSNSCSIYDIDAQRYVRQEGPAAQWLGRVGQALLQTAANDLKNLNTQP